jgi:hypothetical protein
MMIYDEESPSIAQARLRARENPVERPPVTFGEAFMEDLSFFWRENLSISRELAISQARVERGEKVRELTGKTTGIYLPVVGTPTDLKAEREFSELIARYPELETDEELSADTRERNRLLREKRESSLPYRTTGGEVGGYTGTMVGALSDPLVIGTLPLGASWATGILRTMATEALIAGGVEAAIQAPVLSYKKELESPYDLSDALINIGAAAGGAGVLTGGVKATVKALARPGVGRVARRIEGADDVLEMAEKLPSRSGEQDLAISTLRDHADLMRESPFERAHPVLDDLHLKASAKAAGDLEAGRPVDVSEFIEQGRPVRAIELIDEEPLEQIAVRSQVEDILAREDVPIRVEVPGGVPDARGNLPSIERSAREVLRELDEDVEAAKILRSCLSGGR